MGLLKNIKAALFPENADPNGPPAWANRLKPSKYVSLNGTLFDFQYLDLSSFIPIKSASFSSIDGDGAYIQHNGIGGMRFPMLMVLSGVNNDNAAKVAIRALTERGDATLYHPVYGPVNVVPNGEIEQINAFVTAANQTSIIVELLETTGLLTGGLPPFDSALDLYLENAAKSFLDIVNIADKADEVSFASKLKSAIGKVKNVLDRVSAGVAVTQAAVDDTFDSINNAIDTLVKEPLMLARQVQRLLLTPARELGMIKDKLQAYKNMAEDIFTSSPEPKPNSYDYEPLNNYAVDSLMVGSMIAAMALTSENNDFEYKKDFAAAIDNMNTLSDSYIEWADNGADVLEITDNSGDWIDLQNTVSIATKNLLGGISQPATGAKTEIKITTEYRTNTAALCFKLYGSAKPDILEKFQRTNQLGGDEIFYIEAGTEIVYYA